jgi:glycine cleavage system H protein
MNMEESPMHIPSDLKYSEEHVWVRREGNKAVVGITEFAQRELGDIVFVELPGTGEELAAGEPFGSVESVKTVSELYAPVSGKVAAVNESLSDTPEAVNRSPYGEGWLIVLEMKDPAEWDQLWTAEQYAETYADEQP